MDHDTKTSRKDYYKSLKFAGTVDWAIDLGEFRGEAGDPNDKYGEPAPPSLSECEATFDSVEAMGKASDSIPQHCAVQYSVRTLGDLLDASMKNYTDMVNNDYDEKFKVYANAVAGNADSAVHDWVYKHGNKYFTCVIPERSTCCSYCESQLKAGQAIGTCRYCWDGSDSDPCYRPCEGLECGHSNPGHKPIFKHINHTEPCPPDYSERGLPHHKESVYWTLKSDKAKQFYKDLYSGTGIGKSHIKFGNYDRSNGCMPANSLGDGDECWELGMDFNIPKLSGYTTSDVANPKKTVKKALDKSGNIGPQIDTALFELETDSWIGDGTELVDSISVPILMIAQAVEEMGKVIKIANEITRAKQEEIIAAFLGAILFMIPIAGEVLGSIAELADVGAVLTLAGEAANVAEGVSEIVQDPDNAPLAIMNLIFAPASLGDLAKVSKAASIRREMPAAKITKLGPKVSGRLDDLTKVIGKCIA